jgi:hypothetical protein
MNPHELLKSGHNKITVTTIYPDCTHYFNIFVETTPKKYLQEFFHTINKYASVYCIQQITINDIDLSTVFERQNINDYILKNIVDKYTDLCIFPQFLLTSHPSTSFSIYKKLFCSLYMKHGKLFSTKSNIYRPITIDTITSLKFLDDIISVPLDFFDLSNNDSVSLDVLDHFKNDLIWEVVTRWFVKSATIDSIERFKQELDWNELSLNVMLTPQLFNNFKDFWKYESISSNALLNLDVLKEIQKTSHFQNLNWKSISKKIILNPDLITYFDGRWDWNFLCSNDSITPDILLYINNYPDKLNWDNLSHIYVNKKLTKDLLISFKDKWNFNILSLNKLLTSDLIIEFGIYTDSNSDGRWSLSGLYQNPVFINNLDLLKKHYHYLGESFLFSGSQFITSIDVIRFYRDNLNWNFISSNITNLSVDIIREFNTPISYWKWEYLGLNSDIGSKIDVLKEIVSILSTSSSGDSYDFFRNLSQNASLTDETIMEFCNSQKCLNSFFLSSNTCISRKIIKYFSLSEFWNKDLLSNNVAISKLTFQDYMELPLPKLSDPKNKFDYKIIYSKISLDNIPSEIIFSTLFFDYAVSSLDDKIKTVIKRNQDDFYQYNLNRYTIFDLASLIILFL